MTSATCKMLFLLVVFWSCVSGDDVYTCDNTTPLKCEALDKIAISDTNMAPSAAQNLLAQCNAKNDCYIQNKGNECIGISYWCQMSASSLEIHGSKPELETTDSTLYLTSEGYDKGMSQRTTNVDCELKILNQERKKSPTIDIIILELSPFKTARNFCLHVKNVQEPLVCSGSRKMFTSRGSYDAGNGLNFSLTSMDTAPPLPDVRFWMAIHVISDEKPKIHLKCSSVPVTGLPTEEDTSGYTATTSVNDQLTTEQQTFRKPKIMEIGTIITVVLGTVLIIATGIGIVCRQYKMRMFPQTSVAEDSENYDYLDLHNILRSKRTSSVIAVPPPLPKPRNRVLSEASLLDAISRLTLDENYPKEEEASIAGLELDDTTSSSDNESVSEIIMQAAAEKYKAKQASLKNLVDGQPKDVEAASSSGEIDSTRQQDSPKLIQKSAEIRDLCHVIVDENDYSHMPREQRLDAEMKDTISEDDDVCKVIHNVKEVMNELTINEEIDVHVLREMKIEEGNVGEPEESNDANIGQRENEIRDGEEANTIANQNNREGLCSGEYRSGSNEEEDTLDENNAVAVISESHVYGRLGSELLEGIHENEYSRLNYSVSELYESLSTAEHVPSVDDYIKLTLAERADVVQVPGEENELLESLRDDQARALPIANDQESPNTPQQNQGNQNVDTDSAALISLPVGDPTSVRIIVKNEAVVEH